MGEINFVSHSYKETLSLGEKFAKVLKKGDIVCLFGELGVGKTAFVKGLAKGLRLKKAHVHSPTFTLLNVYEGKTPLYHFDLYRITSSELFNLGYEEFFYGQGVTAVEWSERLEELMPAESWNVRLEHAGEDERKIFFSAKGEGLNKRLATLGASLS